MTFCDISLKREGFIKPRQSCSVAEDDFPFLILLHPPLGAEVQEGGFMSSLSDVMEPRAVCMPGKCSIN